MRASVKGQTMNAKFSSRGFSLIEMIFVLAIVLSLVAIFTPLAMDKLGQSKTAKAQADIDTVAVALTNFYSGIGNFSSCDAADCDPLNDAANNLRFLAVGTGAGDPTAELPSDTGNLWTLTAGDLSATPARNNAFNHLVINNPNANGTPDEANIDYRSWRGPYVSKVGPDPWGRAYIVHTGAMQRNGCPVGSPAACAAPLAAGRGWILSAGPDGNIDTGPNVTELAGDDIGHIFCTNC
jgi:prepilin-type N-terminal cleavage/methylation domain-containing protein